MDASKTCLLIMLKYPRPGKVKTRLAMELGEEKSALLYGCFVSRLQATCRRLGKDTLLCCHPDHELADYQVWLGNSYKYMAQGEGDLGRKMEKAFQHAFELGYAGAVLTGSDLPHLPLDSLLKAFKNLDENRCVLGPARDGGYYLVGMNKRAFRPEIFRNIPWSTSRVMDLTLDVLDGLGMEAFILPELYDIDTLKDLKTLLKSHGLNSDTLDALDLAVESYLKDCSKY